MLFGFGLLYHWRRGTVGDRPMPKSSDAPPSKGDMVKVFFILMVTMFLAGVIYQATQFALPKLFETRLADCIAAVQGFADRLISQPGDSVFWVGVAVTSVYTVSGVMQYVAGNARRMTEFFAAELPEFKVIQPEGTYLLWFDCRSLGLDQDALEDLMLNKSKIYFDEGYIFGPEGAGFERINIACPRPLLDEALVRMRDAVRAL